MAGNIKGIIVEIGGDTSGLQNALKKVNSATASLSKELRGINSLLKLDPKNTELLKQKQDVLNQSISTTENKLKQLQKIKDETDTKISNGAKISEENYRALQREIINTQNKLANLKNEASNWTKISNSLSNWGEDLVSIGNKIDNLGTKLTTSLTLPIAGLITVGVKYNTELEQLTTAYSTFLGSAEEANKTIENIKENAKRTPFDVTSLAKANQMLISTGIDADKSQETVMALGEAITATGGGNDELIRMTSNLQQIRNAGKATSMDIRQFAYAGIDVYGLLADYLGKTTQEIKNMEISYEDLAGALQKASKEGGKYYGAMEKSSKTLAGQTKQLKAQFKDMTGQLTQSLMPIAKKLIDYANNLIKKFDNLSDSEKENIVRIGLLVAATGPFLKIWGNLTTLTGNLTTGIGTVTKAIGLAKNGIGNATGPAANLAKVFQGLSSPLGLAAVGITAAVGVIIAQIEKAKKETEAKFNAMADGVNNFYESIQSAEGYLDSFNTTLFATSEEQEELKKQMDEIQSGITQICKTASDERRGYTQEEITQLDKYFEKLRELKNREIEIEQLRADAVRQQAITIAETNKGSLAEYQEVSTQWIATTQKQVDAVVSTIESATIEEIALLNQRYGKEANMQNEAYAKEYNDIMKQKDKKIKLANQEMAEVTSAFSEGYSKRLKQDNSYLDKVREYTNKQQQLLEAHNETIRRISNGEIKTATNKAQAINSENQTFAFHQKELYKEMYKNMSEEQAKELGVWLARLSQTELYGGEISKENQEMINTIIDSYNSMPDDAKRAMSEAMSGMLKGMEDKEPTLFAKASGIANGVISRLKKTFDIHSPSKKTRDIFKNVMKGAELGLEDEEKNLDKEINSIAQNLTSNFSKLIPSMGNIQEAVIDKTKTVFTTPNIVFNVQKMDEANLNTAFNYVNKRLGSKY